MRSLRTSRAIAIWMVGFGLFATGLGDCNVQAQEQAAPLHERIDAMIDVARLGSEPELCTDAQFLRRASLDLVGVIPSSAEARSFLDDTSPQKRAALIDRLLADPRFVRTMQLAFDVWLMERRPAKHVNQTDWSTFLYTAISKNLPLNEIVRQILVADGTDEKQRAAARFYLDREGEKNLVTRDVARVFLGRDIQCSQCHDHPLIDDYLQADYYGLLAFFNRSSLFTDAKAKKSYLAETAEGDMVDFKSVFGGDPQKTRPHLPGAPPVDEPRFEKGQEYVVAPAKDVRPVPRYSRREKLAAELTNGSYRPLPRTLANRLWGHVFGRGIVHPYDMDHSGNPPAHPELLELLTDELVSQGFDLRKFLRELVLTRAYQRSIALPESPMSSPETLEQRLAGAKAQMEKLEGSIESAKQDLSQREKELAPLSAAVETATTELAKAESASREAQKKLASAAAAVQAAKQAIEVNTEAAGRFTELAAVTRNVQDKLSDDQAVVTAAALFAKRIQQAQSSLDEAQKALPARIAEAEAANLQQAAAQDALSKAQTARDAGFATYQQIVNHRRAAELQLSRIRGEVESLKQLLDDGESLKSYVTLSSQSPVSDAAAVDAAFDQWADRWTRRFFVTGLEALTPEQITLSVMQATGQLDSIRTAAEATEKSKLSKDGKSVDPAELAMSVEQAVFAQTSKEIPAFVNVLSPGSGPGVSEYQATVQEALFLKNGAKVAGWLAAKPGNLTDRLTKLSQPPEIADELYLSILTRRPASDEVAKVSLHLTGRDADRALAIEEMVWGLLFSTEFRFSH